MILFKREYTIKSHQDTIFVIFQTPENSKLHDNFHQLVLVGGVVQFSWFPKSHQRTQDYVFKIIFDSGWYLLVVDGSWCSLDTPHFLTFLPNLAIFQRFLKLTKIKNFTISLVSMHIRVEMTHFLTTYLTKHLFQGRFPEIPKKSMFFGIFQFRIKICVQGQKLSGKNALHIHF